MNNKQILNEWTVFKKKITIITYVHPIFRTTAINLKFRMILLQYFSNKYHFQYYMTPPQIHLRIYIFGCLIIFNIVFSTYF